MCRNASIKAVRDDSGFSLSELIVALGLLGVVLAIAWGALYAVTRSNTVSATQGATAAAFADPMEEISKILMQNNAIIMADAYRIEVWTDRNLDALPEKNAFYVNASKELIWESWDYNAARTSFTNHKTWVMNTDNANINTSTPLLQYYDRDHVEITGTDIAALAPSDAVYLKVTVVVQPGAEAAKSDIRDISFRNRY